MESEYIFGAESEGSVFDSAQSDHQAEAVQIAAVPQAGETLPTPLLPHDAAQVVVTPGQNVVHVPVTPGEVIELPFGPDAHFLARLGDGNLAIKVGDVVVVLQGYAAAGDNPPVIEASDGTPLDIATLLAETDPSLDIQTAAGPGAGGQGADNTGAFFQQLGGEGGLGGFLGVGGLDDTSGPGGGDGPDGGPLLRSLSDAPLNQAPAVQDFGVTTDEDTALKGQLTGTDPNGDALTFHAAGTTPTGLTINPDGTWSFDPTGNYDYLAKGEQTTVTFQYQANDGALDSNPGTVTITIDGLNDAASIAGDGAGKVKEDVSAIATGQVTVSDLDHDEAHPLVVTNAASDNGYGTWSVDADGKWTFTLDDANTTVDALPEGGMLTDTFTITSRDGTASQIVTITISGTNDGATIAGDDAGKVKEDVSAIATGQVTVADVDSGEAHPQVVTSAASDNGYGTWSVDTDGNWTFTLDNANKAVNALPEGGTLTDTFTIHSADGTASQVVTITINGTNDGATIAGQIAGDVTEDTDLLEHGHVTVSDPDAGQAGAQPEINVATYGGWSVGANGNWFYLLNDLDPRVQALHAGETLTDTFTVTSADGTADQDITITIHGRDDKAVMFGDTKGSVIDDSGTPATGTLTVIDLDHDQSNTKVVDHAASAKGYGSWSVDADGHWSYKLDDNNADVNKLGANEKLTDTFSVTSLDGSKSLTVTVTIVGHNDAPVIGGMGGAVDYTENDAPTVIDASVTVSDIDSANFNGGSLTVAFTANGTAADQLSVLNQGTGAGQIGVSGSNITYGGVVIGTFSGGANGGDLVIHFNSNTATPDAVKALIQDIAFANNSDNPSTADRAVKFTLVDGDGTALGGADTGSATATVHVAAVNDAPVIGGLGTLTYTENASPTVIDSSVTVSDIDSADFNGGSLKVAFTANGTAADQLSILNQGTGAGQIGISGSNVTYGGTVIGTFSGGANGSDLVITFNSNTATPDAVKALIQDIAFANSSENPSTADRSVTFTLVDGDGKALGGNDTGTATATVHVNAVNDAPVITSDGGGNTATVWITENATAVTKVTSTDAENDVRAYSLSGGVDKALFDINSTTGELSFKNAPDFEHPADKDGDNTYEVTVQVDDGHGGIDTQQISVKVTDITEVPTSNAASDYIFTNETGAFWVPDAWLLANDTGAGLKVDPVDANGTEGYFEPISSIIPPIFAPTPVEFAGNVYIDLDTTNDLGFDRSYLKNGEHTTFDYTAKGAVGSDTATVEVTYVTGSTIDRTGDNHDVIIVGSDGNDTLTGGNGNDFIRGGDGNDLIFGGNCEDSIYGDGGDDVMRYSLDDNIHGGDDSVGKRNDLSGDASDRGDVLAFGQSINLTESQFAGHFDGIETISLKNGEGKGTGAQSLTIGAGNVNEISDHTITPGGVFSEERAVRIDMDAVDQLYLSISKDGGKWSDTGKTVGGYEVFVHDAHSGAAGNSEDAYVLVATANVSHVHLNQDAPAA